MNDHDMDFVTPLLDSSVLSETLALIGEPSVGEFRSALLRARRVYLSARLRAQDLPEKDFKEELAKLSDIAFVLEELSIDLLSFATGEATGHSPINDLYVAVD